MTETLIERGDWLDAVALARPVGRCRAGGCPGRLVPQAPERVRGRTWYTAVCGACGSEVTSPDGRLLGERPAEEAVLVEVVPERERDVRELAANDW